ncbi:MAG: trypsin-like peptidase domain-containing protein, partial [Planctomycetia bacterium]|nr:trypsin-like peptidase domain-containing protein [Planctomycetia bacterium]
KKKGIFTIAGFPVTAKVLLSCAAMLVTLGVASLFGHMMTRSNSPPPETEGASKSPQGVASRPASTEVRKVQPPEKGQADDDWRTSLAVAPSSATSSARGAAGVAAQAKSGPALTVSEIVKKARPSVVRVVIRNRFGKDIGLGSGVIVNASGLVATNYHVVRDAADAYVFLADNTRLEVKGLRGADKDADVAILELGDDPRGKRTYPPIVFSEVEHGQVEQGEAVVAIGHPHGFDMTVTKGIVSAVRWTDQLPPQIRREFANRHRVQWIQTDAAISGGNSGGPLLDDRGRLLGLNTWCDPSGQNLDFAIHEVHVKDLLAHLQSQPGPLPGKADIEESIDLAPEIRQLIVDFRLAQLQFAEELSRQTTAGQRQAYIAAHDPRPQYLDKLKALAAREEKSEKGLHALLAICAMSLDGSPDSQEAIKDASQRILANYVTSTHLELLVTTLMRAKTPDAANLLKQISEKNPNRRIQALATLGEVTVLMADDSQQVQNEAVILTDLDRLEKDYADVEVAGNLLGALAQKIRFEIKNLTVGKIAPEISGKDLDGREMRLSEFHGKVAVLVFWVNWVPPCREIYPQCRQLIEHYEGKPFVLLGVNVDPADDARQVQQSGYIKWRSWGDGPAGPIADQWNVNVYPTTYVLDATGRIRYKNLRGARLEEAVEELLRDAGALLRIPSDLIPSGAAWNYFDDTKSPDANWRLPAFSPTDWPSGKSPLGFGPLEVATKIGPGRSRPRSNSVFFRHTFQMAKSAATEPLLLKLVHSGGAAAYLNGKQVALVNLTRSPKHDSLADELDVSATSRTSYHLIPADCVEDGTNVLAVEVHLDHPERAQATFDATLGSEGVKRLVEQFNGSDSAIRRDVVRIVSKLGGAASAAVPAIVFRLDDKDSAVRADAIRCLGDIGEPADVIMPALAKKVRDENPDVRSWAIL